MKNTKTAGLKRIEKIHRARISVLSLWQKLEKLELPSGFKEEFEVLKGQVWAGNDMLKRAAKDAEEAQTNNSHLANQ